MTDPAVRRGEVWLASVDKTRPVIVMTRDPLGRVLTSVLVVPVTTRDRGLSSEVAMYPEDGVQRPSVANLDNMRLLARRRLIRRVGRVRPATMRSLCSALAIATGCDA